MSFLDRLLAWDRQCLIWLNNASPSFLDGFWQFVTDFKSWIPYFILLITILFYRKPFKGGLVKLTFILVSLGLVGAFMYWVKVSVQRLRPNNDDTINGLIKVLSTPSDYSFFSGHAATSMTVALLFFLLERKGKPWMVFVFIWPMLFSLSRLFVGVHYPIDILVGLTIGTIFAISAFWIFNRVKI